MPGIWPPPSSRLGSTNVRSVIVGADGRGRCWWCGEDPTYVAYHDHEWGRPLHDDRQLYGLLVLEGFQAGLSWITILRKRPAFERAFAGFDPEVVASYGPAWKPSSTSNPYS